MSPLSIYRVEIDRRIRTIVGTGTFLGRLVRSVSLWLSPRGRCENSPEHIV